MNVSELSEAETYTRIKWAAERALALDDRSADAHVAFAATLWCRHNWPGAERELRRAIALNPSDATARTSHALLLLGMDRLDEALAQIRLAAEIDPLEPVTSGHHGLLCYLSRDNACAIREYGRAAEVTPTWGVAHRGLGLAYAREGRTPEAIRSLRKAIELQPERHDFLAGLAQVYALGGQRTEGQAVSFGVLGVLMVQASTQEQGGTTINSDDRRSPRGPDPVLQIGVHRCSSLLLNDALNQRQRPRGEPMPTRAAVPSFSRFSSRLVQRRHLIAERSDPAVPGRASGQSKSHALRDPGATPHFARLRPFFRPMSARKTGMPSSA